MNLYVITYLKEVGATWQTGCPLRLARVPPRRSQSVAGLNCACRNCILYASNQRLLAPLSYRPMFPSSALLRGCDHAYMTCILWLRFMEISTE